MNLTNTTLVIAGLVLIYCAIKDVNPADMIKSALQGKAPDSAGKSTRDNGPTTPPVTPPSGSLKVPGRSSILA